MSLEQVYKISWIYELGTNVTVTVTQELPEVSLVVPVVEAGMDPLVSYGCMRG